MTYQIDQSGKIEQTDKDTVIAYSNGKPYAVLIPRKLKRRCQEAFRLHGFTSVFIYYLFAVGVFYALEKLTKGAQIIIDDEYPNREKLIKSFVQMLLRRNQKPQHAIHFARIGNRPSAHYAAKDVFDRKKECNKRVTMADIIEALKKTDGRLRECLSTLVDARSRSIKTMLPRKR